MMTRVFCYFCLYCFVLSPNISHASTSDSNKSLLQKVFSNPGDARSSGKATLVRTVYTRAFNEADFVGQKEFANDQQKQRYLKNIEREKDFRFSLDQDEIESTIEVLYFDGEKRRRDFVSVSPEKTLEFEDVPKLINDLLPLRTFTYTPDKTILGTAALNNEGKKVNYANITTDKIFFPEFQFFDHGEETKKIETFMELIDKGLATITETETGDEVEIIFEIDNPHHGLKMERLIDKGKDMATLYKATSINGQIQEEIVCADYKKINDDEWYPHAYVSNKYVYLNNQKLLASSTTYEVVPGSVSFNEPIEEVIFEPKLVEGTYVVDSRYAPPLEYDVLGPTMEVFLEPLVKTDVSVAKETTEGADTYHNNEPNGKVGESQSQKIFIPEINSVVGRSKLVLFDLSGGKIIAVHGIKSDEQERLHNTLAKIDKGDIAWDGSLVMLRGATLKYHGKKKKLIDYKKGKKIAKFKIPEDTKLPCNFVVDTKEKAKYLLTVHKIEPSGIWITKDRIPAKNMQE